METKVPKTDAEWRAELSADQYDVLRRKGTERPFTGEATQIPWDDVIFKGLVIKGIYGREIFETWYKMQMMLQSGLDISKVLTHKFDFDDFEKGFEVMMSGNCGKVILELDR